MLKHLEEGEDTCAVHQRRDGTLLRKHAFHTVGLLGMVKAKDIGFTQTECVTCREKKINTQINLRLVFKTRLVFMSLKSTVH